jgi:hydrogenase/urease accessory protein HupE
MSRPALLRRLFVSSAALAAPAAAFAHPGHDGGHDGGLTWDFVGEVLHRLSSPYHLAPAVLVGLLVLGIWKLARNKRDSAEKK